MALDIINPKDALSKPNFTTPLNQSQTPKPVENRQEQASMSDTEKEKVMGAIRSLDNENKKQSLMQSELEQAHIRQAKQFEALQEECKEQLLRADNISKTTSENLLKSVQEVNQSILNQNKELLNSRAEELKQNKELLTLIQSEVKSLTESEKLTRSFLKSNLEDWRDKQAEVVRTQTENSLKGSISKVEVKGKEILAQYEKQAENVNTQWEKYHESNTELQNKAEKWSKLFGRKNIISALIVLASAICLVYAFYLMGGIVKPIAQLNGATNEVDTLTKNLEIVNNQLDTYYSATTGETLSQARISYYWGQKDYLGAVFSWVGAYWKNVLIIGLIASWVIHFFKKDKY